MTQLQKRDYFYLVSSLPEMVLDQSRAPFSVAEFVEQLKSELEPADYQQVRLLLLSYDNDNLLRLLKQDSENWNPLGNFTEEVLSEQLKEESGLPAYMHRFYQAYKNEQPLYPEKSWRNQLNELYYQYALDKSSGFLQQWFVFNQSLSNLLTAWNLRQYKIKNEGQFIGHNDFVKALQKSHARDFGLGREHTYLEKLMNELERDDLMAREKAIDRVKWNFIEEQLTFYYFTVEVVLGYLIQLGMLERWLSLDQQAGQERVRGFISNIEQKIKLT